MKTSTIVGIVVLILIIIGAFALFNDPDDADINNGSDDNSALEGSDQLGNPLQAGISTTTDEFGNVIIDDGLTDEERAEAERIEAEGK